MKEQKNNPTKPNNTFTRRKFITNTAAAAVSFTIIEPSLVRGTKANSRVTVGCIGLGGRGRLIAGMLNKHEAYQIVSVADYFPQVAQQIGDRFNIESNRRFSGLSGYKKLIDGKVDAVFLETPPCFFPDHAAAAVNAGCHVYVAKPVAVDVPGSLSIAASGKKATNNKTVFLADFQTRTDPFFIEAIKRVHNGLIGGLAMLSSFYTDDGFSDPPKTKTIESRLQRLIWVNDIDIGGGQLVAAGIHAVDVALWIAAAHPVSATGSSRTARRKPHGDSADVYSVTYRFEDGLILNHRGEHIRNTHGFQCNCFAFGQDGYTETNYAGKVWVCGNRGGYRGGEVTNLYNKGIAGNLDTFYKSIFNGVYDNPTAAPSVDSTLATILGREAAQRNTMLTWKQMIKENRKVELNLTGLKA
ncbi:MAG TPA: Gfo/Idh/MocA family oxidoreductase [Planctomycetes bacterium]|nr:Gfo/Idh/MocA family oxidoreductase [Planctomycetota bacterium]